MAEGYGCVDGHIPANHSDFIVFVPIFSSKKVTIFDTVEKKNRMCVFFTQYFGTQAL